MCSRYLHEDALISAMARWLRQLPSLENTKDAVIALRDAGFAPRDIRDFMQPAIVAERSRRLAYARIIK